MVPVVIIDSTDDIVQLAEILLASDIPIMEITFRTYAAIECIHTVRKKFPTLLVGAGTVLSCTDLNKAITAGAQFGVAPGLNQVVATEALELNFPFIPGIMTPGEIENAARMGFKLLKFFLQNQLLE